jgi:hypothetical protein
VQCTHPNVEKRNVCIAHVQNEMKEFSLYKEHALFLEGNEDTLNSLSYSAWKICRASHFVKKNARQKYF